MRLSSQGGGRVRCWTSTSVLSRSSDEEMFDDERRQCAYVCGTGGPLRNFSLSLSLPCLWLELALVLSFVCRPYACVSAPPGSLWVYAHLRYGGMPCPKGHFCPGGTETPQRCPDGSTRISVGGRFATDCEECPAS